MKHNKEEKEAIARMKARRIIRKFKRESDFMFNSNAQSYQKGVINGLKKVDTICELENEVLIQITKL